VDGGKGQLNAAKAVLEELGLSHLSVVSLAKKEEIIFTPSRKDGIRLEKTSPVLKLFQSIRDESHRFALSFHRLRRKKKSFESQLDRIMGILDEDNGVRVETTSENLAVHLGRTLYHAYGGDVEYRFSDEQKLARVFWHRKNKEDR